MDGRGKYGSIVILGADGERKEYPPGMPIFVLLGRDPFGVEAIDAYAEALARAADIAPTEERARELERQADDVRAYALNVRAWQLENPEHVKQPD